MNHNGNHHSNNNTTIIDQPTPAAANNLQDTEQQENLPDQFHRQRRVNEPLTYSGAPSPWQLRSPGQNRHENINLYHTGHITNNNRHQPAQQPQQQQPFQTNSRYGRERQNVAAQSTEVSVNNNNTTAAGSNETIGISALRQQVNVLKQELAAKSESNFELNATIATMQAEMDAEINATKLHAKEEASRLQGELRLVQQQALRAQQQLANFKHRQQQDQKQPPQQQLQNVPNQGFQESKVPNAFPNDRLLGVTSAHAEALSKIITSHPTDNSATKRRQSAPADLKKRGISQENNPFHETLGEKQEGMARSRSHALGGNMDSDDSSLNGKRDTSFLQSSHSVPPPIDATKSNISTLMGGGAPSGQVLARHLVELYGSLSKTQLGQQHWSPLRDTLIGIATSTSVAMSPVGISSAREEPNVSNFDFLFMNARTGRRGWTEPMVTWCIVQALAMSVEQSKCHRVRLRQQDKKDGTYESRYRHAEEANEQEARRKNGSSDEPEATPMKVDPVYPPSPGIDETIEPTTRTAEINHADILMSSGNLIQNLLILKHALMVSAVGRSELIECFRSEKQQPKNANDRSLGLANSSEVSHIGLATNATPSKVRRFSSRLRIVSAAAESAYEDDEMEDDEHIVSRIATEVVDKTFRKLQNPFFTRSSEESCSPQLHPQAHLGEHAFSMAQRCYWSRSLLGSLIDLLSWKSYNEGSVELTAASKLLDRSNSYSASLLSCQILALMISSDSRPDNIWWEVCVEPITSAFYYYSSILLGIVSTETTMGKSEPSGDKKNVRLQQQETSPYLPHRHQYRRGRRRRQFRRVATAEHLIQAAMKDKNTKLARDNSDKEMHHVSKLLTALLALLQRLLYVTSTVRIDSWWNASSHPAMSTIADHGMENRSSAGMNVDDNNKLSVPRTASDGTNGYYLISVILDLMEVEWNFKTDSPSWYPEGINLLRYVASIPLEDGTSDIGKIKNQAWNMNVLRTRLYPTTAIFPGESSQEATELDDQGKVIPPPLLGNAIDVAIFSLHKLVLAEPSLSDQRTSNSHRMYLTSCMEAWIRFLHLVFLFVQQQEQQQKDEEEYQNLSERQLPRTIELFRGEEVDEEAQSSKMESNATNSSRKGISFRSLVEDCQDLYTSSYAMILTTPGHNDEDKNRWTNSATWGIRDEIKSMMRLQLEELAMDEEEYEEVHGVSL